MNATTTLRPKANSPLSIEELSAKTSPALTLSPKRTIGRWLRTVLEFERTNLING